MNMVQEMLKLASTERNDDAVQRLNGLFLVMAEQPGFLRAEVLRNFEEPQTLLVLHAWRDRADWQRFQVSSWKVEFTASRPSGLYDMVPCGMNWRSLQAEGTREGAVLRREVVREEALPLRRGEGIEGCQTYVFADEEPVIYRGCTLRLTRLTERGEQSQRNTGALADELYESLLIVPAGAVVS